MTAETSALTLVQRPVDRLTEELNVSGLILLLMCIIMAGAFYLTAKAFLSQIVSKDAQITAARDKYESIAERSIESSLQLKNVIERLSERIK